MPEIFLNEETFLNNCFCPILQEIPPESKPEDEAFDARGIPGWDKVDSLAEALIAIEGLSVTTSQATTIKALYEALLDYDKRPITFRTRTVKPTRGRFARRKSSGHVTVEAMKR